MIIEFTEKVKEIDKSFLTFNKLDTLQINLGNLCNQRCLHCHVEAGPNGNNIMKRDVIDKIVEYISKNPGLIVDITGGAPEMNPNFKYLVESSLPYAARIMVRTNLTIFFEKGYEWLPDWYSDNGIALIASMPCYTEENVDKQRGAGVFKKSIDALKILNKKGYGNSLELNLVYNPGGPFLPGNQNDLEKDYKRILYDNYGIVFNNLFTITNAPIGKFEESLSKRNELDNYMQTLLDNFNPQAVESIMCRSIINIDWQGILYNCDFNQAKKMPIKDDNGNVLSINEIDAINSGSPIATDYHCYICTAGAGSCCTGALVNT